MSKKAIFLDRDGTLIVDKDYQYKIHDITLLPGAQEGLSLMKQLGYDLFLFTNQSGIGRGYFTLEEAEHCNEAMVKMFGLGMDLFKETKIAPERPDQPSRYRKPSPRFILEMIEKYAYDPSQCWMVGDKMSDVQAGLNAGIHGAFICSGKEEPKEFGKVPYYPSLLAFARQLDASNE